MENYRKKLKEFYKNHHRLPSYKEMEELLGYASKGGVQHTVKKLLLENFLGKDKGKIVPGSEFFKIKILGTIEAGFPTIAEEDSSNTLSIDELLINHKEATYLVRVKGDSMKDAGILEGDLVLIDRALTPKPGEIVVADVDGEYTLKFLRKKENQFFLEPANKNFKPIYPKGELRIQGVVVGVVRKYQ